MDNLLASWREFLRGKRKRPDVADFSLRLMDNVLALHQKLTSKAYKHGGYVAFRINDPKPRHIHKAAVRDRLVHHAIYRTLYPFFDRKFIHDSYSCRRGKGTHKALNRFEQVARIVSRNHTRTCWVLKCDVKRFFASVDHQVLKENLNKYIADDKTIWLLNEIIDSFHSSSNSGAGLPLGNLTSQLLVNIYMNEFDHFVKRDLKVGYYIRYADDFVILSPDKKYLEGLVSEISNFLSRRLKLVLHPRKVFIKSFASGVDFLGWVHFPHHRVLRTSTKKRMLRRVRESSKAEALVSYLGLLKHGNTFKVKNEVIDML